MDDGIARGGARWDEVSIDDAIFFVILVCQQRYKYVSHDTYLSLGFNDKYEIKNAFALFSANASLCIFAYYVCYGVESKLFSNIMSGR